MSKNWHETVKPPPEPVQDSRDYLHKLAGRATHETTVAIHDLLRRYDRMRQALRLAEEVLASGRHECGPVCQCGLDAALTAIREAKT